MNIDIEIDESKIKKIGTIRVDLKEAKQIGKIDIPVIKGDNGKDGANGKDGKDGQDGANGKDGTSIVSVEQIVESTESNGINQIEVKLSNGESSIFNVRNGKEGKSGAGGTDYDDSELRRLIDKKVDKETGKSLIEDTEIERLSKVKNYDDTELRGLIEETLQDAKDYTDTEIANFDFVKIVNSLPDVGLPNKVYFVPKEESETNNIFEEYAWINGAWEYFGTKTVEVDLSDVNAQLENLSKNKADKTEIRTKTSQLENDSNFITEEDVPESDGILTGSIIGWQGDTIPEGYEEVENNGGIETITNANGTATKFPDGTLICRGFANVEANATNTTITFPFEFISNEYNVILTNRYLYNAYVVWSLASPTITSLAVYPVDTSTKKAPTFATRADYVVIGRWK